MSSCFNTIAGCYVYEGTLWYKSMGYVWSDYWTFEGFDNDCGCGVITRMTLPLMKETTIIALTKPTKDTMDQDIQSPATTSTCSIYDREPSPHVLLQFPIKKNIWEIVVGITARYLLRKLPMLLRPLLPLSTTFSRLQPTKLPCNGS